MEATGSRIHTHARTWYTVDSCRLSSLADEVSASTLVSPDVRTPQAVVTTVPLGKPLMAMYTIYLRNNSHATREEASTSGRRRQAQAHDRLRCIDGRLAWPTTQWSELQWCP